MYETWTNNEHIARLFEQTDRRVILLLAIRSLSEQGYSIRRIADGLGLSRMQVHRLLQHTSVPVVGTVHGEVF